jgi:allophanate hydrolase subunit 2
MIWEVEIKKNNITVECESSKVIQITKCTNGLSAYELAVANGFTGTLEEYLESNAFVWASTNW